MHLISQDLVGRFLSSSTLSITKSKFELQLHVALNQDILSDGVFYKKRLLCPLYLKWHIRNFGSNSGGLCYDAYRAGIFLADFGHSLTHGHS